VIDGIVAEPRGGAHEDPDEAAASLKHAVVRSLEELEGLRPDELRRSRRAKFRAMGVFA
jgi:acetyl-CoA carboxylase alpha subunit